MKNEQKQEKITMKKLAIALLLSAAIMMTGCQGDKTGDTPAASKTEEVNQASDERKAW